MTEDKVNPFAESEDNQSVSAHPKFSLNLPAGTSAPKSLTSSKSLISTHPVPVFVNKIININLRNKIQTKAAVIAAKTPHKATAVEQNKPHLTPPPATVDHGKPTSVVEDPKKQVTTNQVQQNKFPAIKVEQQVNTIRNIIRDEFGGGKRVERIMPAIYKVLVD